MEFKTLDKYNFFEATEYYYSKQLKILFDKNKNILIFSNISLLKNDYFNLCRNEISKIKLEDTLFETYDNIMMIQHWFTTYGHFMDEIINLYNFYELFNNKKFICLMNFKLVNYINYSFDNYNIVKELLFNDTNFINASNLNNEIIKISNLILIKHEIKSPMFHMFPQIVINKITEQIINSSLDINYNKNLFITRGKALHLPRNLNNQEEIEKYFIEHKYNVINPELLDFKTFINNIRIAENIYITWGGTMVNLCFVNPNTNIYLLQSKSYEKENIFDIFKFLRCYNNLYLIKCDDNNNIDMTNCVITKISL